MEVLKKGLLGFYFEDEKGRKTGYYSSVEKTEDGFYILKDIKSPLVYFRDLLGNLSFQKTQMGRTLFKYSNGQLSFEEALRVAGGDIRFLEFAKRCEAKNIMDNLPALDSAFNEINKKWAEIEKKCKDTFARCQLEREVKKERDKIRKDNERKQATERKKARERALNERVNYESSIKYTPIVDSVAGTKENSMTLNRK